MMKKIGFVSVLSLTCLTAHADWISYQRHAEAEEFHESTPLTREQGRITLWTLTDYVNPITTLEGTEVSSDKFLMTVDCATKKMGSAQVIRYAGKKAEGDVVNSMETVLRLTSVRAGGPDAVLLEKLCR